MNDITIAIKELRPNSSFGVRGSDIIWNDPNNELPTESEIQAKVAELAAAEPLRLLREQRNQLLQQSDWMAVSDRVMTQAQIDYRQALRDLPETADPQLDENGQLTNVTWPAYE
jgi:hypothetical protein